MSETSNAEQREHGLTMQVFSVSSAMVGVCLTAIGILRLVVAQSRAETVGDDLLAFNAVLFVTCSTLSFWSFKTRRSDIRRRLRWIVDALFLVALVGMAAISSILVYELV